MLINGKWLDAASARLFRPLIRRRAKFWPWSPRAISETSTRLYKLRDGLFRMVLVTADLLGAGRLLWKLADLLEANIEEFATLESLDNGKPVGVARAADIPLAVDLFRYMAGWSTKIEGTTIPISVPYTPGAKYLAYTLREPVAWPDRFIPWNFPLLMAAWKLGPALASGCTVVLKPAEQTLFPSCVWVS